MLPSQPTESGPHGSPPAPARWRLYLLIVLVLAAAALVLAAFVLTPP